MSTSDVSLIYLRYAGVGSKPPSITVSFEATIPDILQFLGSPWTSKELRSGAHVRISPKIARSSIIQEAPFQLELTIYEILLLYRTNIATVGPAIFPRNLTNILKDIVFVYLRRINFCVRIEN